MVASKLTAHRGRVVELDGVSESDNSKWHIGVYAALLITLLIMLYLTTSAWIFTPDSGIYVGTAMELLENQRYWFNTYPNLIYYPGTSVLVALVMWLGDASFHVLNVFLLLQFALLCYFFSRYYNRQVHGLVAALGLVLFASNTLCISHAFVVRSDPVFACLVLASFLCWRHYLTTGFQRFRLLCVLAIAASGLVRIESVLLLAAFVVADVCLVYRQLGLIQACKRTFLPALLGFSTFLLWTIRNYLLYTPEAFNTIGYRFFGQASQLLYAPDSLAEASTDRIWPATISNILRSLDGLLDTIISDRLGSYIPAEIAVVILLGLACIGVRRWWRTAHLLEAVFVGLVLALLIYLQVSSGSSELIVTRYWTPILGSVCIVLVYGAVQLREWLRPGLIKQALGYFFLSVLALSIANGVATARYYQSVGEQYVDGRRAIEAASSLVESLTDGEAIIAVNDFGVTPFFTDRKTIKTLNDRSNLYTINLLQRYGASYVINVSDLDNRASPQTAELVLTYPKIFLPVQHFSTTSGLFATSVYRLDLDELTKLVTSAEFSQLCESHGLFWGNCSGAQQHQTAGQ